jgi:hypothetical protein
MSRRVAAIAGLLAALITSAAGAQGVCVECRGPDRGYRCTVKDSERVQGIRGSGRAIELLCLSEIARAGGHESCRAGNSYSGPCIGQHYEVDISKAAEAPSESAQAGAQEPDKEKAAALAERKGPPQTLEELARDTLAKSKDQLSEADKQVKKAGEAVGGAVQQTWDCLTSLFKRC